MNEPALLLHNSYTGCHGGYGTMARAKDHITTGKPQLRATHRIGAVAKLTRSRQKHCHLKSLKGPFIGLPEFSL